MDQEQFIAHDWCGFGERYGRYTHLPSGDTLVCRPDMGQVEWDKAQLAYMKKYPGLNVHECPGRYTTDDPLLGTVDDIIVRLEKKLGITSTGGQDG